MIKAGARTVNIPDTVGYSMPVEYGRIIDEIMNNVPNIHQAVVSVHCHNDLGMAVANSLEAVRRGAGQVECTINGIGERAGNAAMEEIVMAIKTRSDIYKAETNINTREICKTSRLVSKLTGFVVQPNKAIVGGNAFRHESGIHQDGVLKERTTYEIIRPEDVGFVGTGLVLGKHSGRHAFRSRMKALGVELTDAGLDQAFERFKDVADKKKQVFDEDLLALVADEVKAFKQTWVLEDLEFTSGLKVKPAVKVILKSKGKKMMAVSTGDGPVDACYRAIDRITKMKGELLDYSIQSVTEGKDALGEVSIKVKLNGTTIMARGASTDIVAASVNAYLNAVNKALVQTDVAALRVSGRAGNP